MYKRTLSLLLVAGLASAGLILGGTSVMSHISPVSAAQPPALIAGGGGGASGSTSLFADSKASGLRQDGQTAMPVPSDTPSASQPWPAWQSQSGQPAGSSTSQAQPALMQPGPAVTVTIAELLANPSSYLGRVVSTAGRVTLLGSDKLLINDGTGQIIVDLKDELKRATIADGAIIAVEGKVDQISAGTALNITARSVTASNGATAAGKPGGDKPAPPAPKPAQPAPTTNCDDDDCGDDDSGDDNNGDDHSGNDDNGDDDNGGDDDGGDDDGSDDDNGDDDGSDDDGGDDGGDD